MAYGDPLKTTTISVKLTDDDLAKLDGLVENKDFCEAGMPGRPRPRVVVHAETTHALRAALRAAAAG